MNTDIDFMKIAEGDKAFVHEFENFVNGKMSSAEKTGMAMTTMHRYLQQQAFKVFMGYMKALAHNYRRGFMMTATSGPHVSPPRHTATSLRPP